MKIPILNGIFTDNQPDFQASYPVNMVPVAGDTGINSGYLKPHDGIMELGAGPGLDRGGIERLGVHYRVMGTKLVSIDAEGNAVELGNIGGTDQVPFRPQSSYSFDLLAIAASGNLYYYNASSIELFGIAPNTIFQVSDENLGKVIDVVFLNGVFVVTDGEVVRSSSITNPTEFNPLAYESSEFDPDPVVALLRYRSELYVVNKKSIEVFQGAITGGDIYLPFLPIAGAQMTKGCVGTLACCIFSDSIAFVGGGHNEPPSVYLGRNSQTARISTRAIDSLLAGYTKEQLSSIMVESRKYKNHDQLYIHLPDRAIVYDASASATFEVPVWFQLTTSTSGFEQYGARGFVYSYGKWFVGDPNSNSISAFDETVSSQRGDKFRWQFDTSILYNGGNGAIVNELELVALTGRNVPGTNPKISTSYSIDGLTYSQKQYVDAGNTGQRNKRLVWYRNGHMKNWRIQRFEGDSDAHISIARLEAQVEPLAY